MFLTGQRDPDLIILKDLNDKDLLSVCITNKYANWLCNNEDFWRNRFIEKFGHKNMKYKAEKRSWKNFYLLIVKYLNGSENWDLGIKNAIKEGYKDLVEFFLSKMADIDIDFLDFLMMKSAQKGYQDLVNLFIEKGAKYWEGGMRYAAIGGHKELVDFFIKRGARDWNSGMSGAAEGGHENLVKFFINKGANDFDLGLVYAAQGGHKNLVNFFINKGSIYFRGGIKAAAEGGYKDLVKFIKDKEEKMKIKK